MWASWRLEYYSRLGPGPGFFPVWLSGVLAGLSLIWFYQACREPDEPIREGFIPGYAGMIRIASILAALAFMGLFMETVGFQLTMFAFLFFLLVALGRRSLVLTLFISLAGSFGMYYAFKTWLGVQLPESSIGWLNSLGL